MNDVPPHILEWRRKTGADRWDEVWVIDRDSRACAIHAVEDGKLRQREADPHGWIASAFGVELRTADHQIEIRLLGDAASCGRVP